MHLPFNGDGVKEPFGADGITGLAADTALRKLDALTRELAYGQDLEQELTAAQKLDKVLALTDEWSRSPRHRPPAGVPRQEECWDTKAATAMARIANAVRDTLRDVTNVSRQPITVLGADGDLAERTDAFRTHVRAEQPAVSVSPSGCMRRWLATGDTTSVSLSIVTYIPGKPLYAATVTPKTALLSDCAGSWRLTLTDGWQAMTGEPLIADPAPGYIVLPSSLQHLAPQLSRYYTEPLFVHDTSSAIAQAVLGGAVPVAVHSTGDVLNSAILPVAIGHGMIVRFHDSGQLLEKPWEASKYMYKAVTGEIPFGEGLVIARDIWAARRAGRILTRETELLEQTDPLDVFLDEFLDDEFDGEFDQHDILFGYDKEDT
ncbi:hypothetical protein [Streptomyces chartreusis]|uniref:hypothetical protein n=1 Tax=Streptomyces chartreusis TaxID=1969 RepID=UPI00365B8EF5